MPDTIASPRNPLLKEVRRAIARGSLTSDGFAVAESFHLYEEALRSGCEIRAVLVAESAAARLVTPLMRVLPDALFHEIAATETSQGVMTLVKPRAWTLEHFPAGPLLVALDGVQDPGNAGTIVRSAEAFGAAGVLLLKGSVNPYNPKALRASAGSLFRLPVVSGVEPEAAFEWFARHRLPVYAALPSSSRPLEAVDFREPCVVVIGSEGQGVSSPFRQQALPFSIPTSHVESLNAAVAASVILYEAARQRRRQ